MKHYSLKNGEYDVSLLSDVEYTQYCALIPVIKDWWWLRSSNDDKTSIKFVSIDGEKNDFGWEPFYQLGVRPTLRFSSMDSEIGEIFSALGNRWIALDKHFCISLDTITHMRFDEDNQCIWEKEFKTKQTNPCSLKKYLVQWALDGEE